MRNPVLRLVVAVVVVIPAAAIASAAQRAFDLGPNATFGVLMAMGFVAALVAEAIVRAWLARERRRER